MLLPILDAADYCCCFAADAMLFRRQLLLLPLDRCFADFHFDYACCSPPMMLLPRRT